MIIRKNNYLNIFLKIIIASSCLKSIALHSAISIVYNLRIAEATKRPAFEKSNTPHSIGITGFNTNRKRLKGIHHNAGGILTTFLYTKPSFFFRTDFAFGKVEESDGMCTKFSRTQTDDILFSGGYSFPIRKRIKLTFSGLFGIPTHKDLTFEGIQFGSGHIGLGLQMDGAFLYRSNKKHTIRTAARYIHFIGRKVAAKVDKVLRYFDYHLGNVVDLFLSHHFIFGHHSFETGFDETFVFGAKIVPCLDDVVKKTNYLRSSFYSTYKHRFVLREVNNAIAVAFSYAFDTTPKEFGNKRILTAWASWGVSF